MTFEPLDPSDDPCAQIQADLSAMLDGELDAASVRRVMVHSDACPSCCRFLDSIRLQARSHRQLHAVMTADDGETIDVPTSVPGTRVRVPAAELRRQLTGNAEQLARIFYELGRGFVLMGLSPNFSRVVAREPVPIPDMFQRGRILLDEVSRMTDPEAVPVEWVRARELFGNDWRRDPNENLRKGMQLLREALMLFPDFHDARIYLGHAYHVAGEPERAIGQFREVLDRTPEVGARGFALLNLGNVHLENGDLVEAERAFLDLVHSGAIEQSPQFGLIYFNLALAYGMQERFDECQVWLQRLYSEMPHKRRMIADEFRCREDFIESLSRHPDVYENLATSFPCWFPKKEAC